MILICDIVFGKRSFTLYHVGYYILVLHSFLFLSDKLEGFYLYRVRTEMGEQNSRTFPGLFQDFFSFFKDSISSKFCVKQREKMHFFSRKYLSGNRKKRCTHSL